MAKTTTRIKKTRPSAVRTKVKPARKVWYVDTGKLTAKQAEARLKRFKNKPKKAGIAEGFDLDDPSLKREIQEFFAGKDTTVQSPTYNTYADGARVPKDVAKRERLTNEDIVMKARAIGEIMADPQPAPPFSEPVFIKASHPALKISDVDLDNELKITRTEILQQEFKDSVRRLVHHLFAEAITEAFPTQG